MNASAAKRSAIDNTKFILLMRIEHLAYSGETKMVVHSKLDLDTKTYLSELGYDLQEVIPTHNGQVATVIDWSNPTI